jgi:hypothetical protein
VHADICRSDLAVKDKKKLLRENQATMSIVRAQPVLHTKTIVWQLLGFSLIVILAGLITAFFNKDLHDVALSITGTVVGGTIASIAQKLGQI